MAKWNPGESGNPGGRPKGYGEIRDIARAHTNLALETLVGVASNPNAPPSAKVAAAIALLDRGWGRPDTNLNTNISGVASWIDVLKQIEHERGNRLPAIEHDGGQKGSH